MLEQSRGFHDRSYFHPNKCLSCLLTVMASKSLDLPFPKAKGNQTNKIIYLQLASERVATFFNLRCMRIFLGVI